MSRSLLIRAESVLNGSHPQRARMAAWLARAALEGAVLARLDAAGLDTGEASMRSRLTCLESVDPDAGHRADQTWGLLSRASHHHAYDLAPAVGEVRDWIERVRQLDVPVDATGPRPGGKAGADAG